MFDIFETCANTNIKFDVFVQNIASMMMDHQLPNAFCLILKISFAINQSKLR